MTTPDVSPSPALPVQKVRPAYQQVADQLRELVMRGKLAPGDRLPAESELASIFGVSRSTVREALRALTSRDLLVTVRGTTGGTFVARVQPHQVSDYLEASIGLMSGDGMSVGEILEARELLEVPAAGLAAERRTADHLRLMEEALEHEERSRTRGLKFREHRQFHGVVIAAAHNSLLDVMTEPMFRVLQGRFLRDDLTEDYWRAIDNDHRDIAALIAAGDGPGAETAMREHLRRLRGVYQS
ncbi:FadR/GntR family transcriptional regulator [Micromonosporaceae bacterium DT55]|uniref:FadR/GntR family transcriptional regulator n=1 Tax=Melissospora conviva TaxID=3388432 RepID=UPI003C295ED3